MRQTSSNYHILLLFYVKGDNLGDEVEVNILNTNATLADTDGNGVSDADEDSDVSHLPACSLKSRHRLSNYDQLLLIAGIGRWTE